MSDSSAARAAILESIRTSLGAQSTPAQIAEEYAALPRDYKRSSTLDSSALRDLFQNRLEEYDAGVYRTTSAQIAATIAGIVESRKKHSLAIPEGVPAAWLPPEAQPLQEHCIGPAEFPRSQLSPQNKVLPSLARLTQTSSASLRCWQRNLKASRAVRYRGAWPMWR